MQIRAIVITLLSQSFLTQTVTMPHTARNCLCLRRNLTCNKSGWMAGQLGVHAWACGCHEQDVRIPVRGASLVSHKA